MNIGNQPGDTLNADPLSTDELDSLPEPYRSRVWATIGHLRNDVTADAERIDAARETILEDIANLELKIDTEDGVILVTCDEMDDDEVHDALCESLDSFSEWITDWTAVK